jgi:hypothetical protein
MEPFLIIRITDGRLHITRDVVTDAAADEVSEQERTDLEKALRERLAGVGPFSVEVGSTIVHRNCVLVDSRPDEGAWPHWRNGSAARSTPYAELSPPTSIPECSTMSAGYPAADVDTDAVAPLLRRIRPSHALLRGNAVHLVEVFWSLVPTPVAGVRGWSIDWTPVAEIPLGRAVRGKRGFEEGRADA